MCLHRLGLLPAARRAVLGGRAAGEGIYVNPHRTVRDRRAVGDAGLIGRKIIVYTYGGFARHGGGAFSGKDPSKVDRSAAYAARYLAKNIVAAGLATTVEVQVAYAIGVARPLSLLIETFGTEQVPVGTIRKLVDYHFDLRPAAFRARLRLHRPVYAKTAAYGHFGRDDVDFSWEAADLAAALRAAAGLDPRCATRVGRPDQLAARRWRPPRPPRLANWFTVPAPEWGATRRMVAWCAADASAV